jgi:hypothetical protein
MPPHTRAYISRPLIAAASGTHCRCARASFGYSTASLSSDHRQPPLAQPSSSGLWLLSANHRFDSLGRHRPNHLGHHWPIHPWLSPPRCVHGRHPDRLGLLPALFPRATTTPAATSPAASAATRPDRLGLPPLPQLPYSVLV